MFLGKELMLSLTYGGLSYSRCLIQKHHRGSPVNLWVLAAALSPYSPSPADPWAVLFVMTARSVAVGHGRTTKCGCISSVAVLVTNRTVPLSRFATCQQIGLVGLTWRWQKPHDLYRQLARRSGMIDIEPTEKARRIGLLLLYMGSSVTADMLSFKNE
ncbi:hypothetical protein DER44DRAFT_749395 [Fusarium oxysporum]|nr:hypothetical protein DER44DRAFT_749395 [Fusarium oxysporum]